MKGKQNCKHNECGKGSMVRVFTIFYYRERKAMSNGEITQKKYGTHTESTFFYLCSKCAWITDVNTITWPEAKFIMVDYGPLALYLVPDSLTEKVSALNDMSQHDKEDYCCVECKQSKLVKPEMQETIHDQGRSFTPTGNDKEWPTVIKLYLKDRDNYLGYYCRYCKVAYCLTVFPDWENSAKGSFQYYKVIHAEFPFSYASTGKRYSPFHHMKERARKI